MSIRLLPWLAALALASCTPSQRQTNVPVASPFTGTWHETVSVETNAAQPGEPIGFLAIDGGRVLFNLPSLPRGPVEITSNETVPGLRSGRLVFADGRVLYLAIGDSLALRDSLEGRLLTMTQHLDIQLFAAGSGAGDQPQKSLRLWPSAALAVAELPWLERTSPPVTALQAPPAPVVYAPPTNPALARNALPQDQQFLARFAQLGDPFLTDLAGRLAEARADGVSLGDLDALYRRSTVVLRAEAVRDLDAARLGDRSALTRVDTRLTNLAVADRAYDAWRDRR